MQLLKRHVSPHSFFKAFLKGYRFVSREDARSSLVTAAGDSSEVIMWSLGWFETTEQLVSSEVRAITHSARVFLLSFFFFPGMPSHTRLLLSPNMRETHVIFKKEEISWTLRFARSSPTVIRAISEILTIERWIFYWQLQCWFCHQNLDNKSENYKSVSYFCFSCSHWQIQSIRETHSLMFWLTFPDHTALCLDSSYVSFCSLFATGPLPLKANCSTLNPPNYLSDNVPAASLRFRRSFPAALESIDSFGLHSA